MRCTWFCQILFLISENHLTQICIFFSFKNLAYERIAIYKYFAELISMSCVLLYYQTFIKFQDNVLYSFILFFNHWFGWLTLYKLQILSSICLMETLHTIFPHRHAYHYTLLCFEKNTEQNYPDYQIFYYHYRGVKDWKLFNP